MKSNPVASSLTRPTRWLACLGVGFGMYCNLKTTAQFTLEAPFTQITNSPVVAQAAPWMTPAWGDYDNDGWIDLFVANFSSGGRHGLFHNNRDGTFSKITVGSVVSEASPGTYGAAWADYNNDGWLDLLVSSANRTFQPSRLYRNTGGGSFVRMGAAEVGSLATDAAHAFGVAWADYDRDGFLDLFVANGPTDIPQADFLFHNDGNGRFARVTNDVTLPELATAHGAWADFDNDGRMDLLVAQLVTGNQLFRTDGQGHFSEVTTPNLPPFDTISASVGVARGDYDNDGDLDVVIVNLGWQGPIVRNWLYRNRGDGSFEAVTSRLIAEDEDHFASGSWVDYDNDGWLDLFVTILGPETSSAAGVFNRLYRNQGDGTFALVTQGSLVTRTGNAGGAAWGDYDNDGFPDVCVAYGTVFSAQRSALFRNNGNSNGWIKIRCVGTDSNRSAIGVKVRVKAKIGGEDFWQMRQIGCDQDWIAFNSLDALIGLGDATVVDTLRIEWPSGRVQEFHHLPTKQTLVVVERTELAIAPAGANSFDLTITGPRQQRYRLDASAELTHWSPVGSLTIANQNGTATYTYTPAGNGPAQFVRAIPE